MSAVATQQPQAIKPQPRASGAGSTASSQAVAGASRADAAALNLDEDLDSGRPLKKQMVSPSNSGVKIEARGSATRRSTPSDKNMNKGLRQISIRLCEKVKEKIKTTYSEVADELAEEFSGQSSEKGKTDNGFSPGAEKNIRRRVYDALNVLFSAGVIQKEKKHIMWRGLPEQLEVQSLEKDKRDIKKRVNEKKGLVRELHEKQRHFEMLLARNRNPEFSEYSRKRKAEQIKLPFIVVKTKATTQWRKWERQVAAGQGINGLSPAALQPEASVMSVPAQGATGTGLDALGAAGNPATIGGEQYIIYDFSDEFQLQDDNEVLHKMAGSGLLGEETAAAALGAGMSGIPNMD